MHESDLVYRDRLGQYAFANLVLIFNGFEYLFHDFWVKCFSRMKRNNDPPPLLHIDSVTAFATYQ